VTVTRAAPSVEMAGTTLAVTTWAVRGRDYRGSVGLVEWLLAHLLGPFVNLANAIRAWFNRPKPELRIYDVQSTGGGGTFVDFQVDMQNRGTKAMRYTVTARVEDVPVEPVNPNVVDLVPNALPTTVRVHVPRPALGTLLKEFNDDATLYGRELVIEVADDEGKRRGTATWREHVYGRGELCAA
jgi:hypothetical protein